MKSLLPNGSAEFRNLPSPFGGVARVSCSESCTATGTWNFAFSGQGSFAVGISPIEPTEAAATWAAPVPPVGPESGFGIAVYNASAQATTCSVTYRSLGGEMAAVDLIPLDQETIPAGGQTASLSPNVPTNVPPELIGPDGFSGSVVLECDDPVIAVVINQDQVNGFPTPIALDQR